MSGSVVGKLNEVITMILVGIKKDSFEDKNSGKVIEYGQLHVMEERSNMRGHAVQILKVATSFLSGLNNLEIGTEIEAYYDRYGKVVAVDSLPSSGK